MKKNFWPKNDHVDNIFSTLSHFSGVFKKGNFFRFFMILGKTKKGISFEKRPPEIDQVYMIKRNIWFPSPPPLLSILQRSSKKVIFVKNGVFWGMVFLPHPVEVISPLLWPNRSQIFDKNAIFPSTEQIPTYLPTYLPIYLRISTRIKTLKGNYSI